MDKAKKFFLLYLRLLAKIQLWKIRPLVIGVGGSSGKSSTSYLISLILKTKYKIRQSGGKNSETGIPLSVLFVSPKDYSIKDWLRISLVGLFRIIFDWDKYEIYIAEMGIDGPKEPKNMSYLLKIIKPKIAVLTNISLEHSQYFDYLVEGEEKREEKILSLTAGQESLLITSLGKDGIVVINNDDSEILKYIDNIKSSIVNVSLKNNRADFFAKNIDLGIDFFSFSFKYREKEYKVKISQPLPVHYIYSILFAIAVSKEAGFGIEEAIKALEKSFSLPAGRMNVFEGIKGSVVIDSSYNNATLIPLLDILDMLKKIGKSKRKIAILGDMRELGTLSATQHKIVADKILNTCDFAVIIGPLMQKFVAPVLMEHKFPFYEFPNFTEGREKIRELIEPGDIILVKSSQNTLYLERVVEILLKNIKDKDKLCRRGEFWDKKRAESL